MKKLCDSFINGILTEKEKRKIGLQPWNEKIIDRTRYIMGGSLGALNSEIHSKGIQEIWLEVLTMLITPRVSRILYFQ
ncbi:hypothetical protein Ct9H90mP29_07080 [bacterium]|nr:MAG: hypothetical protein Ct9H90mP29_07080 [bacterium]